MYMYMYLIFVVVFLDEAIESAVSSDVAHLLVVLHHVGGQFVGFTR